VEGDGDPFLGEVTVGPGVQAGGAPDGDQTKQAEQPAQELAQQGDVVCVSKKEVHIHEVPDATETSDCHYCAKHVEQEEEEPEDVALEAEGQLGCQKRLVEHEDEGG